MSGTSNRLSTTGGSPSARTAANLVWVLVALAVVSIVWQVVRLDDLVVEARDLDDGLSEEDARVGVIAGLALLGGFGVLVRLFFAIALRGGRAWVRILFTVYALLVVVLSVVSFGSDGDGVTKAISAAELLAAAGALWFAWRPDARVSNG